MSFVFILSYVFLIARFNYFPAVLKERGDHWGWISTTWQSEIQESSKDAVRSMQWFPGLVL